MAAQTGITAPGAHCPSKLRLRVRSEAHRPTAAVAPIQPQCRGQRAASLKDTWCARRHSPLTPASRTGAPLRRRVRAKAPPPFPLHHSRQRPGLGAPVRRRVRVKALPVAARGHLRAAARVHAQVRRHGPVDLRRLEKVLERRGAGPVDEQHPASERQGERQAAQRVWRPLGPSSALLDPHEASATHRLCAMASWMVGSSPRTRSPTP